MLKDPHTISLVEGRRIRLWKWIARCAFGLAIAGAVLATYPEILL